MSDRDELADVVFSVNGDHDALDSAAIADAVLMAGWRKKPSYDDLYHLIMTERDKFPRVPNDIDSGDLADAILALMENGDTDER